MEYDNFYLYPWHWPPYASYSSLVLTNSDLTADLTDNTNYSLLQGSWSPSVAGDSPGAMGGRPYNRVTESINVLVRGSSRTHALENLEKLVRLLKLAEQWRYDKAKNVGDTPAKLQYEPQGSAEGAWSALVLGRTDPTRNYLTLPVSFNEELVLYEIEGVRLELLREGEWLGTISAPLAVDTGASGDILTITYARDWPTPGPAAVSLSGIGGINAPDLQESYLFLAHTASDIKVVEAEIATGGGSVIDEDAANARGTSGVNALQLTGAKSWQSVELDFTASAILHKNVAIYAVMRNDDSRNWRLRIETTNNGVVNDTTWVSELDDSSATPRPHAFGTVESALDTHTGMTLYYAVDSATGSPTLTIDYFVLIGLDNPVNRVIHLIPPDGLSEITDLTVDPQQLSGMSPRITALNVSTQNFSIPWDKGDAYCLSSGTTLTGLWMAPSGNYWRWSQSGGTLISSIDFSANRQRCVLVPR